MKTTSIARLLKKRLSDHRASKDGAWRKATSTGVTKAVKMSATVVTRSQYAMHLLVRGSMIVPVQHLAIAPLRGCFVPGGNLIVESLGGAALLLHSCNGSQGGHSRQ